VKKCASTRTAEAYWNKAVKRTRCVYQFKVTLRDVSPPIWRRIQVWGDYTLDQLHRVLQMAMGWENYHEYEFHVAGRNYRLPDPDEPDVLDAKRTRISNVFIKPGSDSEYVYDFGDYWRHDLQLETVSEPEPNAAYPRCLDGARNCPPEDVGGAPAYEDYLAALADPCHKAHQEMILWRGRFDPETFSVEKFNHRIGEKFRAIPKRNRLRATPAELREAVSRVPLVGTRERIRVTPDETVPLELTAREYKLIRTATSRVYSLTSHLEALPKTGEGRILRITLNGLDDLARDVAAEVFQARNPRLRNELHWLFNKIRGTLDEYTKADNGNAC